MLEYEESIYLVRNCWLTGVGTVVGGSSSGRFVQFSLWVARFAGVDLVTFRRFVQAYSGVLVEREGADSEQSAKSLFYCSHRIAVCLE